MIRNAGARSNSRRRKPPMRYARILSIGLVATVAVTFQLGDDVALASNVFIARRNMFLCLREVALEHFSVHSGRVL
jgi:hypothetical protein